MSNFSVLNSFGNFFKDAGSVFSVISSKQYDIELYDKEYEDLKNLLSKEKIIDEDFQRIKQILEDNKFSYIDRMKNPNQRASYREILQTIKKDNYSKVKDFFYYNGLGYFLYAVIMVLMFIFGIVKLVSR